VIPAQAILQGYLPALGVTLLLEVPIVAALYPGRCRRLALACALATTATHLLLHLAFPALLPRGTALLAGEAFATVAEAAVYWFAGGEPGRALVASALANAASFTVGPLLLLLG
jgi:hypothetical protein